MVWALMPERFSRSLMVNEFMKFSPSISPRGGNEGDHLEDYKMFFVTNICYYIASSLRRNPFIGIPMGIIFHHLFLTKPYYKQQYNFVQPNNKNILPNR